MNTSYLVTGGAGFIGSHVVRELVKRGAHVRVVDNLTTGNPEAIADVKEHVEFIEGDVRDPQCLKQVCTGVDTILHFAAWRAVGRSIDDPRGSHETNVTGTLNVLIAGRDAGVKRVVNASTSAVYGECGDAEASETISPDPQSPYAVGKLAAEAYCKLFSDTYGLETVSLRLFNVYGRNQPTESEYSLVIPIFIERLLMGQAPEIHGTGEQRRDFVFIDDVVSATYLAATSKRPMTGTTYNIASGEVATINEINQQLQSLLGRTVSAVYGPSREGDVNSTRADISRAKNELQFSPQYTLEEGLALTLEHHWSRSKAPLQTNRNATSHSTK